MDWDKKTAVNRAALEHFKNRCPVVRTDSYPIPQGLLSESFHEGMVGNVWLRGVDFEFGSSDVYFAFPSRWHISDMFSWMYRHHPLRHHTFVPNSDGIVFPMSAICFRAAGERETYSLRTWLGDTFIPVIWPDLLREGMKIITERRARVSNPESLEALLEDRSHLGEDPASLSFYKPTNRTE